MSQAPELAPVPDVADENGPAAQDQGGELLPATLPSLIHDLYQERATGLLTLHDGALRKTVYVQAGKLVFAQSTDPDDRLGELLLRKGVLSIRGLERYNEQVSTAGHRLGAFLIERGILTPVEIIDGVQEQVKEILLSLFDWTRGDYTFRNGPLPTREVITLQMNTLQVLWNGIHRIRTWSRIRDAVGGLESVYQTAPDAAEGLGLSLSDGNTNLLRFCASPVSVGAICDTLPGNNPELCCTLWAFHVMGAVHSVEPEPDGPR